MKRALLALAIGTTLSVAAQAGPLYSNNFDGGALNGMTTANSSTPGGTTSWFQGVPEIFAAQSGAADSYLAANFNSAPAGGTISNMLSTGYLVTSGNVVLTFWAKGANDAGFEDHFKVDYETLGGVKTMLAADITAAADWTQYTYFLGTNGSGRFNITYFGAADASDYLGIDTLAVNVPEPSSVALMGVALAGLVASRRKAGKKA